MPPPPAAQATHTATLLAFLAAASAPTPLYRIYQAQWHFSPAVLTQRLSVLPLAAGM